MTLKVIGVGFGRTGTASLKAALEELGFVKCYHASEIMKNPSHAAFWKAVLDGEQVNWHEFFRDYRATVDWPGLTYYKQLMDLYPDAKVLLSVRDPEHWYESTKATIYRIADSLFMKLVMLIAPHMRTMYPVITRIVWQNTFDNRFEDKEYAIQIFNRHIEEVKQYVPAERLLVYNVQEGWEPLCRFLEVKVPVDKPFPHVNERVMIQRAMRWGSLVIFVVLGGLLVLLIWVVLLFLR